MARRRCAECGRRSSGRFCSACGAALRSSRSDFADQAWEAFDVHGLVDTLKSTALVGIRPIKMANDWVKGRERPASPVKVFVGVIAVSTVIVSLVIPPIVDLLVEAGANPSQNTLAFQWRGVFDRWFSKAYEASLADPAAHLLRLRHVHNLFLFPLQGILTAVALWFVFRHTGDRRLTKSEAQAVGLYVTAGVYLQALIIISIGFYILDPLVLTFGALWGWVATVVGFGIAINRIKGTRKLSTYGRSAVAYGLTLLLYYPAALVLDLVAVHPNRLLDAL